MKKNLFFVLLSLAFALSSCRDIYDNIQGSSTSLDNTMKITAMIGDEVGTRDGLASDTLTTTNIKAFFMRAFCGSDALIDTASSTTGPGYSKGWFTKTENVWKDSSSMTLPYYWPADKVTFVAFSTSEYTATTGSLPSTGFTMSKDSLCWKDFQVEASGSSPKTQRDYIAAVATQSGADGNSVTLHFQHLLSRLSINIWAPSHKFSNTKRLDVLSFKFDSVGVKGTFKFDSTSTNNAQFRTKHWKDVTKDTVGTVGNHWSLADSIPLAASLQNSGKKLSEKTPWLNVIPGKYPADSLTVYIKLKSKKDSTYYRSLGLKIPAYSVKQKDAGSSDDTYHPGYQYIYNLKVTGQDDDEGKLDSLKIELQDVTVATWGDYHYDTPSTNEVGDNTLQAIFKSAEAFAVINMRKDVEILGTTEKKDTVVVSKEATLNLNGYDLTVGSSATQQIFTIAAGAKLIIDNDTTSTSSHGHSGSITNSSSSATLFKRLATSNADSGKVVIRGGTFNFNPLSPCYIEGTKVDSLSHNDSTIYHASYFKDAYGNKKYRETLVLKKDSKYLVEQTIKDYTE